MASGSFESSTGTNLEIGCEWSSTPSVPSNTSSVRIRVYLKHYEIYCAALSGSSVFAGSETRYYSKAVSSPSGGLQKTYVADETFTVSHGADGNCAVRLGATYVFNGVYNGHYVGTLSVSQDVRLDRIPRATEFSSPQTLTLTEGAKITLSPASGSFTHRAVCRLGSKSYTTSVTSNSFTLTPPASLADGARDTSSPTGTLTVETYSGSSKIGEKVKNVTFKIPSTAEFTPDFTLNFSPSYGTPWLSSRTIMAEGISSCSVSVSNTTFRHGATLSSVFIVLDSKKHSGAAFQSLPLSAGRHTYSATVVDSRGKSVTKSSSFEVEPYAPPYPASPSVFRCGAGGEPADDGEYLFASSGASFTSLGEENAASLTVSLARRDGTEIGSYSLTPGVASVLALHLSPRSSYIATVAAEDSVGRRGEYSVRIPTCLVDFHLKNSSLRLGGYVERAGFECDWDASFGGDVSIGGSVIADFVTECGTEGIWTWRKWASGASECYGTTNVKNYPLTYRYGDFYQSSGAAGQGENSEGYPEGLFVSPPTVTVTPARGDSAVIAVQRDAGGNTRSPNYYILYPILPQSGEVSSALSIAARGRWK